MALANEFGLGQDPAKIKEFLPRKNENCVILQNKGIPVVLAL